MSNVFKTLGFLSLANAPFVEIVAGCDDESLSWHADGTMFEATCWIEARYNTAHGDLFGDEPLLLQVKDIITQNSLAGGVSWADEGLQDDGIARFDMDIGLVEQIWPQFKLDVSNLPGMR